MVAAHPTQPTVIVGGFLSVHLQNRRMRKDQEPLFVDGRQHTVSDVGRLQHVTRGSDRAGREAGQRVALPNARIMLHQPSGGFRGQASDIERHAEDIIRTKRRLNELYAKHCGRTYEEVEKTLDRDHFMDAEEAKAWGIVDRVESAREEAAAT